MLRKTVFILLSIALLVLSAAVAGGLMHHTTPAVAVSAPPQCGQPAISLTRTGVSWATYTDYQAGLLSVSYSVSNQGPDAFNAWIKGSMNTNGVIQANPGYLIGTIYTGNSATLTLQYYVPPGVTNFRNQVFMAADDGCGTTYEFPGPYPDAPAASVQHWSHSSSSWLGADGIHIYSGTTNRLRNPLLADADNNGVADFWSTWNQNGKFNPTFSVQQPTTAQAGNEQVIRLTSAVGLVATDWFGLYMRQNYPDTKWAVSADVRIDWLPGTTQAEKDALSGFSVQMTATGSTPSKTLGKADIGTGWRRVWTNSMQYAANTDFFTQLRCSMPAGSWSSAAGGIEIRIRRPQLENTLSMRGFGNATPSAMPSDPGVTLNASGEPTRAVGYAQIGYRVGEGVNDQIGVSPFSLDTSQDWAAFSEWIEDQDLAELLPNDSDFQIWNLDNHWDEQAPPFSEIHMDLDGSWDFPGQNRLMMFIWDPNGSWNDWYYDSVDLNPVIRAGDLCRAVYWKTGGMEYTKLSVYRNDSLITTRLMTKPITVANNLGVLRQVTLGNDHKIWLGQTHAGNVTFQHFSVEQQTVDMTAVDGFLTSGVRAQVPATHFWWDLSTGGDRAIMTTD